jgi:hypothetical protein
MKKTGIKLLAAFVCIGFLTGCNLLGPSKKDVQQALEAAFRAFEVSTTQNEPEYKNMYTNAADAVFRNDDESLVHELSLLIDEGKISVTGNCVMTDYEDAISPYILSGELAYEVTYNQKNARRGGAGSMTGELTMSGGKIQFIDFSFVMAENGQLEEFEIYADGKNIDFADDQNPYSLFKALSGRLPG